MRRSVLAAPLRSPSARVSALALLALLAAPAALAQCTEPSALDLTPTVEPLRVRKDAAGGLLLTWEDVGAAAYRVSRGNLDTLFHDSRYDHVVFERPATPSLAMPMPARDRYFLVADDCADDSVGRDSNGDERPRSGLVRVTVGVEGGSGVFGVQVSVTYPQASAIIEADMVDAVGPFAPGSPGSPLLAAGDLVAGTVSGLVTFTVLSPDPSFDPPAPGATDVLAFDFGYFGAPPVAGDFTLDGCQVRDALTQEVPGASCVVTAVDVLF